MYTLLLIIHVIGCLFLIGIVLMQTGKGGLGSALGGDSEMFGGRGAAPFLTKATTVLAVLFMLTSLSLSFMSGRQAKARSAIEKSLQPGQGQQAPAQSQQPQQSGQPSQKLPGGTK
ncbi:preprotein translocase subunit SecG [candidate division TA06 bacterium]|uniref:Protein-export membrane protein SecG n=1 Tax=candidate division TA06 bacterium TaxID=2250710 RepID=A0A933MKH2_UNCT6|nr:preprotein translocase subunit SecG [candidate division TA06 bacterium]